MAALLLVACSSSGSTGDHDTRERSERAPESAVLYTIASTTDPYGSNSPAGFGVASGVTRGRPRRAELRDGDYGWFGGAEWLFGGPILVHRRAPPFRRAEIFRLRDGRLERAGTAPFTSGSHYAWSPDWRWLAWELPAPCRRGQRPLFRCHRGSGRIHLANGDGRHARFWLNATLGGWTRDGRLVVYRTRQDEVRGRALVLDLSTGRRIVRSRYWLGAQPLPRPTGATSPLTRARDERR